MLSICQLFEDDSFQMPATADEAIVADYANDPLHSASHDIPAYDEQKEKLRDNSGNIWGMYGGFALPPGEHKTFDMPEIRHLGPGETENGNGIMKRIAFPEYRQTTGNELVDSLPKYYNINGPINSLRGVGDAGVETAGTNILNRIKDWYLPLER